MGMQWMRLVCVVAMAWTTACSNSGDGGDTPPPPGFCTLNSDCQAGEICNGGTCLPGACDPSIEPTCGPTADGAERDPYCCKVWQNCDPILFQCGRDPLAVGIGCPVTEPDCIPCDGNEQCGLGNFCSAGRCFAFEGRGTCAESFQCPGGQRCDRTEFVCVPDNGGCNFCSEDFRELCCQEGTEACNNESGQCTPVGVDVECTVETQTDDCRPLEFCNAVGQCVQCDSDDDCGVDSLRCNVALGSCYSPAGSCDSNDDCPSQQVCAVAQGQCVFAECRQDGDCGQGFPSDPRERCDIDSYTCFLPPATCQETDEPNNELAMASAATLVNGYAGVLCRGDRDLVSFPVSALRSYTVNVTVLDEINEFGFGSDAIGIELLDEDGALLSGNSIEDRNSPVRLRGATGPNTAADARFYLRVLTGTAVDYDRWRYSVTLQEAEVDVTVDCSADAQMGQEPNNNFANATVLTAGVPLVASRCGIADEDYFRIDVPLQTGLNVIVDDFTAAIGNLDVQVYDGPSTGDQIASGTTSTDREEVNAPEGPTTFYIRVKLANVDALPDQGYSIVVTPRPRSIDCANDIGENDDTQAQAQALPTVVVGTPITLDDVIRCNNQDQDHFRFVMPANAAGNLSIRFNHGEGNLRLSLLEEDGSEVDSSDTSSAANGSEAIAIPVATSDTTYLVRVRGPATGGMSAQRYDLTVGTYDAAVCAFSEVETDDTAARARCVGAADHPNCDDDTRWDSLTPAVDLAACAAATGADQPDNCARLCGEDDKDYYRLGLLELGQSVEVTISYDRSLGALTARMFSLSAANATTAVGAFVNDGDDGLEDGVIRLARVTATNGQRKQHAILVGPAGGVGHEAQPYLVSFSLGGACSPDDNESGNNEGNGDPATATLLNSTDTIEASLCVGDVDVYEAILLPNEQVTATLLGPSGAQLRIGTRPADLTDDAVTVAGPVEVMGGRAELSYTSNNLRQVYFSIKRDAADAIGDYTLTLISSSGPVGEGEGEGEEGEGEGEVDVDSDGDGVLDAADAEPNNPCVPSTNVLVCSSGDNDGDGTSNGSDAEPTNPCVPSTNVLVCSSGDNDGDGVLNGVDPAPTDPCVPNACVGLAVDAAIYTRPALITVTHTLASSTDWVSIAPVGSQPNDYLSWSSKDADNQLVFLSQAFPPGFYVARSHLDNGAAILEESAPFEVR
jgi:hypothetical protein